jgi:hypothetical protein
MRPTRRPSSGRPRIMVRRWASENGERRLAVTAFRR